MKRVKAQPVEREFDGYGVKAVDLTGHVKSGGKPGPGDLAIINGFALVPLKADDVAVYSARIANDQIDRDQERFTSELLEDFAATLAGKSLCVAHEWGPPGVGRFFKASTEEDAGVKWVTGDFYLLREPESPDSQGIVQKVDAGIAWAMSIGFRAPSIAAVYGEDGEILMWEWRRGVDGKRGESLEASLVFLGAQYDAAVVKGVMAAHAKQLRESDPDAALEHALDAAIDKSVAGQLRAGFASMLKAITGTPNDKKTPAVDAPVAVVPEPAKPADAGAAGAEEREMTKEERDALVAEMQAGLVKSMTDVVGKQIGDAIAPVSGALAEVKAAVTQQSEKITALDDRLGKLETAENEAAEEIGGAVEKMLDRLEAVETVLGAPQGGAAEEVTDEGKEKKKDAKDLGKASMYDLIVPKGMHQR